MEPVDLLERVLLKERFFFFPETINRFSIYQKLLSEWNRRINLISHSDEERIVTRHFLQSIGLLKIISFPINSNILDLGSGAGFPGIPIKLIRPDLFMVLAESIKKKANFLKTVILQLNLQSVQVYSKRIDESDCLNRPVDFVLARSVTNLTNLVRWSYSSLKPGGRLIAIKGSRAEEELRDFNKQCHQFQISKCNIIPYNPFPDVFSLKESFVVIIERQVYDI